jgi:hypothetical protein
MVLQKLKKLDKRHTGYEYFKYCIEFSGQQRSLLLSRTRSYCWSQFGAGVDVFTFRRWVKDLTAEEIKDYAINEQWAWHDQDYVSRVYIKGDEELLIMKLAGLVA